MSDPVSKARIRLNAGESQSALSMSESNHLEVKQATSSSSLLHLLPGVRKRGKLLVFSYHNLIEQNDDSGRVGLPRIVFDRQVRWIARHFDVLGLREGISRCVSGDLDRLSACITFDDGYRTHMTIGAETLDRLGITASMFVTTGHLGDAVLWNDRVRMFLARCDAHGRRKLVHELENISVCALGSSSKLSNDDIERGVKYLSVASRNELFVLVPELLDMEPENAVSRMLDADDLRTLRRNGFEIGAHTLEHPILKVESFDEARRQITDDLANLKSILGEEISCFAFPNGMPNLDFGSRELELLASSRIKFALTSAFGHFHAGHDPLQVPRVSLEGERHLEFVRISAAAYRARNQCLARAVTTNDSPAENITPLPAALNRKARLQFISFHFAPSKAVGARRPTATARFLSEHFDITVVKATSIGAGSCDADENLPDWIPSVVEIPQSAPSSRGWGAELNSVLRKLHRKRVIARLAVPEGAESTGNLDSPSTNSAGMRDTADRQLGLMESAIDFYRSIDGLLQKKKWWLTRGTIRMVRARCRSRSDIVVASGPPMVSLVLGAIAATVSSARLVLDFRDPWYIYGEREHDELNWGRAGRLAGGIERAILVRTVRRADAVVAASPGIRKHLLALDILRTGTPVHVIRNGYEPDMLINIPPPHGRLQILYAGSLYWNRNPFPFLEALQRLVSRSDVQRSSVRLRMLGNCYFWNDIELAPWLANRGLDDVVRLEGMVSAEVVRRATVDSNLLVNFAQGQKKQIPAKSYEYIAARRRTLVLAERDSDVAALFREAGVGNVVEPGNVAGLDVALWEAWESTRNPPDPDAAHTIDIERFGRYAQLVQFERVVRFVLDD